MEQPGSDRSDGFAHALRPECPTPAQPRSSPDRLGRRERSAPRLQGLRGRWPTILRRPPQHPMLPPGREEPKPRFAAQPVCGRGHPVSKDAMPPDLSLRACAAPSYGPTDHGHAERSVTAKAARGSRPACGTEAARDVREGRRGWETAPNEADDDKRGRAREPAGLHAEKRHSSWVTKERQKPPRRFGFVNPPGATPVSPPARYFSSRPAPRPRPAIYFHPRNPQAAPRMAGKPISRCSSANLHPRNHHGRQVTEGQSEEILTEAVQGQQRRGFEEGGCCRQVRRRQEEVTAAHRAFRIRFKPAGRPFLFLPSPA